MDRRNFLKSISATVVCSLIPTVSSAWAINQTRHLKLYNVNNGELIEAPFWRNGYYDSDGISKLTYFFRDWRQNKTHHIDTDLFELLYAIQDNLDLHESGLHLISGYRTAKTNNLLRRLGGKKTGVASRSLHMDGLAADIRAPNRKLSQLRNVARGENVGGVGYYPRSNFVHVDVGRLRSW